MIRAAMLLPALLASGCAISQEADSPAGEYSSALPDTPGLALLEHLLTQQFAGEPGAPLTVCATLEGESAGPLPEEVEVALIERYPGLAPYGRCIWDDGRVIDGMTGDPARIYRVYDVACAAPGDCTAMGGWVAGNLGAEYEQYRVRRHGAGWSFARTGLSVMS